MLFAYALPLKNLYITGRDHKKEWKFSEAELESVKKSQTFDATKLSTEELFTELDSWAGYNRGKAADELVNRALKDEKFKATLLDRCHKLALDQTATNMTRTGACVILSKVTDVSSVKILVKALTDKNTLVKAMSAKGLGKFPREAVMPHINTILDLCASTIKPTFPLQEGDPLQYAQGHLGKLLFSRNWGLLKDNIDGIDRKKLLAAGRAVAKNPAGGFRSEVSNLYKQLNKEETFKIGEAIIDGIQTPAPADSMFHGGIVYSGMELLSKHGIEEGLLLKGSLSPERRIEYLSRYNLSKLSFDMRMKVLEDVGDLKLIEGVDVSKVYKALLNADSKKPLLKMKKINSVTAGKSTLKLPENETSLEVSAVNYSRLNPKDTTYTWRKVYGPGKVSFSSNKSHQSKTTQVKFIDKKPGKYRFHVTMSDTLGFYNITSEVDIELTGNSTRNTNPTTKSASFKASPGIPQSINLTGADPDGDELGFIITQKPKNGRLSGCGANLDYTAKYGFNGTDTFTYKVVDGRGGSAAGKVDLKVSDTDVQVAVYEGFDYQTLSLDDDDTSGSGRLMHGLQNKKSHGFSGPWKVIKKAKNYELSKGSLKLYGIPSKGEKVQSKGSHRYMHRNLDSSVISKHKLFSNGGELWFSVILQQKKISGFKFGFMASERSGSNEKLAVVTDRGLKLQGRERGAIASPPWNRGSDEFKFPKNQPYMLVGHCKWGKTDKDPDIISIYRVLNVPKIGPVVVLKRPMLFTDKEIIHQEKLTRFFFDSNGSNIDEIRMGTSLHSVLIGTKPMKK